MPAATFSSRTTGVAPLAVFFSACDTVSPSYTSGVDQPAGGNIFHEWKYSWDFDDPDSGTWGTTGKSKNAEVGYTAAHVFEEAGTYTVTLTTVEPDGTTTEWTQNVVVSAFSGTTYYFSNAGDDANDGLSPAEAKETITEMMSLLAADTQFLFNRGDTFDNPGGQNITQSGVHIGAYGTGANPIWQTAIDSDAGYISNDNIRITDVDFERTFATGGTGWQLEGSAVRSNTLFYNVNIDGWNNNYSWGTVGTEDLHTGVFIMGGSSTNANAYCLIMDSMKFALVGCSLGPIGTAQHVFRAGTCHQGVVSHCEFVLDGSNTLVNMHSQTEATAFPKTKFVNFYANSFEGAVASVSLRPQNNTNDERVTQVIFDSCLFTAHDETAQGALFISATWVTVRNCIFIGTLNGDYRGIKAGKRGAEPTTDNIFLINNSFYKGDAGSSFIAIEFEGDIDTVLTMNNLASAPLATSDAMTGGGTPTDPTHTTNLLTDTPGWTDEANGDFTLESDSAARDAGTTTVIARLDYEGNARPDDTDYDIGAFEFTEAPVGGPGAAIDNYYSRSRRRRRGRGRL